MSTRNLACLRRGDLGRVISVDKGDPSAKRLADLGFIQGALVEMLRPGSPCIVRLANTRFGLSAGLQGSILLAPCDPFSSPEAGVARDAEATREAAVMLPLAVQTGAA